MSLRYRLTERAARDLEAIVSFIAADNPDAAIRVIDAFEAAFALLAARPQIGHVREDLTSRPARFWRVYSYLIAYEPSRPLTVLAILHGARDIGAILDEES